ncbi:MAG: 1-(5-phosphoribosyl)-5-((5-phosphoribosylamino)methylideneamino)imidazole-4-carboxamide isomerase [Firmicutes bacterium ML8_F2]|nr:MAG: 1-(5-phosphoribosyl)-5-((5-phosphoribosylamino)methylideneamino)imidazole-4-carboxamide isomerase [Firmicutes bacterium ML8_F2]
MLIIPAIDLRRGRCVRLYQGNPDKETVYGDNPVDVARQWEHLGARMLHLVDLDGAFTGQSQNAPVIGAIGEAVGIPLQLGGGIRTREAVEKALSTGISRVILGTLVIEESRLACDLIEEYTDSIVVGIDARDGTVAVKGWTESSSVQAIELASRVESWGVKEIIYTDIRRDGTLSGPDLAGLEEILGKTGLQVIVSGGISSLDDLHALKPYRERVRGVIIGKALYSNQLTLTDAMNIFN